MAITSFISKRAGVLNGLLLREVFDPKNKFVLKNRLFCPYLKQYILPGVNNRLAFIVPLTVMTEIANRILSFPASDTFIC